MKKNGFTLVELMGVVIILAVVGLITIPIVDRFIQEGKQNAYDQQIKTIRLAAQNWAIDHTTSLPSIKGEHINVSLQDLYQGDYLEGPLKNPLTKNDMSGCVIITKSGENKLFDYDYAEPCVAP